MLERVAIHPSRLRTPGLAVDARGVALGARGIVLCASIERLVAFLALFTRRSSLADVVSSLRIEVVRSKLGAPEVAFSMPAESSERMDRVADVARLVGAATFTGSGRHFVQYRDASAPFGYDAVDLLATDEAVVLYHCAFTRACEVERAIDLRALLLRLAPRVDASAGAAPGPRWVVAEEGLGPALLGYLVRSRVAGDVALAEWPPPSPLESDPVRRFLFRLPEVPGRMAPLFGGTPGLGMFYEAAAGVAVETGHAHPVTLAACPVFAEAGLVLFRSRGRPPLEVPRMPALGPLDGFARVALDGRPGEPAERAIRAGAPSAVRVPLRIAPASGPWRDVVACLVAPDELHLLRRLAYALSSRALGRTRFALTDEGAFLVNPDGVDAMPIGTFFGMLRPGLYVAAGWSPLPEVSADVLLGSLGAAAGHATFLLPGGRVVGVPDAAFVPLEQAVLEGGSWAPLRAEPIGSLDAAALPEIAYGQGAGGVPKDLGGGEGGGDDPAGVR